MEGRPGSAFTLASDTLAPTTSWRVLVNQNVVGVATTDASGALRVVLQTDARALAGTYRVIVQPVQSLTRSAERSWVYTLRTDAPLRSRETQHTVVAVPAEILPAEIIRVWLPLLSGR